MRSVMESSSVRVRPVETDAELEAYVAVANEAVPDDIPWDARKLRERRERESRRLYLLAECAGEPVAVGFAAPSDNTDRGFVAPRVLPAARRRRIGSAL